MIHLFNDEMVNDFNQVTKDWDLERNDIIEILMALESRRQCYEKLLPRTEKLIKMFEEFLDENMK